MTSRSSYEVLHDEFVLTLLLLPLRSSCEVVHAESVLTPLRNYEFLTLGKTFWTSRSHYNMSTV